MNNRTKYELHLTSECKGICNSHINLQLATCNSPCDSQLVIRTTNIFPILYQFSHSPNFLPSLFRKIMVCILVRVPHRVPHMGPHGGYPRFYNYPNIVADDCHLSGSIFFWGGGGGGRDLAEPDQQVLPTSSRVLTINFHIN